MKKYITLLTFVCALFLGMQTTTAQNTTPEIKAKLKTIELSKKLELTDAQIKQVYEIYLAFETNSEGDAGMTLEKARKQISSLLQPEQQQQFAKTFSNEMLRQRKLEKAGAGGR
jgi:Spy/CpxP family protein refolding chaperone